MRREQQHRSTATRPDGGGPQETRRDSDLREWTSMDALPVVCKQGVRGSSPLSSTGQNQNSNVRTESTAGKYSSSTLLKARTDVRIGALPGGEQLRAWAARILAQRGSIPLTRTFLFVSGW